MELHFKWPTGGGFYLRLVRDTHTLRSVFLVVLQIRIGGKKKNNKQQQ